MLCATVSPPLLPLLSIKTQTGEQVNNCWAGFLLLIFTNCQLSRKHNEIGGGGKAVLQSITKYYIVSAPIVDLPLTVVLASVRRFSRQRQILITGLKHVGITDASHTGVRACV